MEVVIPSVEEKKTVDSFVMILLLLVAFLGPRITCNSRYDIGPRQSRTSHMGIATSNGKSLRGE
jgi:hypothetical protein